MKSASMRPTEALPLYRLYQAMLNAAGEQKHHLQTSFMIAAAAAVTEALALLSFYPLLTKIIEPENMFGSLYLWVGLFILLALMDAVFRYKDFRHSHSEHYVDYGHHMKVSIGNKLRRVPLEALEQKRTGDITSAVANSTEDVSMMSHVVAKMFLRPIVVPFVVIIGMLFIEWKIALLMLFLFPLAVPLYLSRRDKISRGISILTNAHKDMTGDILEYTQGIAVLRACDSVGEKSDKLLQSVQRVHDIQRYGLMKSVLPKTLLSVIVELGLWLCIAFSVWLISSGSMAITTLVVMMVIVTRFAEPMTLFLDFTTGLEIFDKGLQAINKLFALSELESGKETLSKTEFDIQLSQASYRYPDAQNDALNHINLTIPSRTMMALVGESGSGKTTLIKLLMRYSDLSAGNITIGGTNICSVSQETLMAHFSVVFQEPYLFDDTIMNNIRIANPNASDEEVKQAATLAYCDEFISRLPNGYHTDVGEIGGRLSGGEKQRISIARAILKDAPIVILDEPTASLDTESEVAVQKAIDALVENRTVIVIAHRLSTVIGATTIAVMSKGEIVESGTHEELINRKGRYHDLWQAQQSSKNWSV